MRFVSLMLLVAVIWLLMDHHLTKVNESYHRGFNDGLASVKKPSIDTACLAWWLESNIIDVKKRICKK